MNTTTAPAPTALAKDFSDLVALLDELTSAQNDLGQLETDLNASHLANVRLHVDRYKDLQTRLGSAKAAIEVIAARNPQWFEEKQTLETPFGDVKRTTSTSLVVADENATIALIRAAKREEDFLKTQTVIRLEALESLEDHELAKYGVRREKKHNFKPAAASVDLGKSVKAAEKTDKSAKKTVRNAVAATGAVLAVLLALAGAPRLAAASDDAGTHGSRTLLGGGTMSAATRAYNAIRSSLDRVSGKPPADRARASAPAPKIAPVKLAATSDLGHWLDVQRVKVIGKQHTFLVEVSPELATAWLKFNSGNRAPSKAKIRRFAQAMKTHHWEINGETIKFSVSGRLIDGQSRLMAIIEAGVTVVLEVRGGLPDIAQQSMDCGELRKNSHTLEMLGENNPGILAPALKHVWLWSRGSLAKKKFGESMVLENAEVKPLLEKHSALKQSVGWVSGLQSKAKTLMPLSECAFFHYACGLECVETRNAFFESLIDGVALTKVSPVYHLRERLLASRAGTNPVTKVERFALVIKAWNAAVAGEKLPGLRFTTRGPAAEGFPVLKGTPKP